MNADNTHDVNIWNTLPYVLHTTFRLMSVQWWVNCLLIHSIWLSSVENETDVGANSSHFVNLHTEIPRMGKQSISQDKAHSNRWCSRSFDLLSIVEISCNVTRWKWSKNYREGNMWGLSNIMFKSLNTTMKKNSIYEYGFARYCHFLWKPILNCPAVITGTRHYLLKWGVLTCHLYKATCGPFY